MAVVVSGCASNFARRRRTPSDRAVSDIVGVEHLLSFTLISLQKGRGYQAWVLVELSQHGLKIQPMMFGNLRNRAVSRMASMAWSTFLCRSHTSW